MNVLSLFDGISCARVALERCGFQVDKYYASEIDKYAIQVAQKNYPDTIQLGDVKSITKEMVGDIDLLIGGSPCQNLSNAGNKKGLEGEESKLFYEFIRILKEIKPKYFVLENVASMSPENKKKMSEIISCSPIMINASLVSAQDRKRLFWTNISNITQPQNRNITLSDIWTGGIDITDRILAKRVGTLAYKKAFGNIRNIMQKSKTLTCGGQSISNSGATNIKIDNKYFTLTPIECERLQSLPDNYTEGLSNTQRYKCLGNAFNVEVVRHILSFIK
jgi:site-specific DNA-cytosine methylase